MRRADRPSWPPWANAFESIGFAAIEGHGFTNAERDALQAVIQDFFHQSTEDKLRSHEPCGQGTARLHTFWRGACQG